MNLKLDEVRRDPKNLDRKAPINSNPKKETGVEFVGSYRRLTRKGNFGGRKDILITEKPNESHAMSGDFNRGQIHDDMQVQYKSSRLRQKVGDFRERSEDLSEAYWDGGGGRGGGRGGSGSGEAQRRQLRGKGGLAGNREPTPSLEESGSIQMGIDETNIFQSKRLRLKNQKTANRSRELYIEEDPESEVSEFP